jgi:hypothetical protein
MRRFALVWLSLVAAACAPMEWTKSDAAPEELQADMKACREQAWREASWIWPNQYGGISPMLYSDPLGRRLLSWPLYTPFADPYGDRFMQEARLTDFCMRAKGYELSPLKK